MEGSSSDKYFVGLLLTADLTDKVTRWQKLLGFYSKHRPPPHITIGFNKFTPNDLEKIIPLLRDLITKTPSLKLRFAGMGTFPNQPVVLYLQVNPSQDLLKLNQTVTKLTGPSDYPKFHPHITLAKLPANGIKEAIKLIGQENTSFDFTTTRLALFRQGHDGVWQEFAI